MYIAQTAFTVRKKAVARGQKPSAPLDDPAHLMTPTGAKSFSRAAARFGRVLLRYVLIDADGCHVHVTIPLMLLLPSQILLGGIQNVLKFEKIAYNASWSKSISPIW